jgi:uncharacterized repeat protein (TIGR01451 family)
MADRSESPDAFASRLGNEGLGALSGLIRATRATIGAITIGLLSLAATPRAAHTQQTDLVLNVTTAPLSVPATGLVTYSVTVNNNSITTATGVVYTMTVPVGASYNTFTVGGGASCSGMTGGQAGPGTVTCTLPNLIGGATVAFTVKLRLNVAGTTNVPQSVSSTTTDGDLSNNSVTSATTVVTGADFSVTLTAPATLPSGSTFNYGLTVNNAGPDPATALQGQFPVPTGFTPSGSFPSGCVNSAGTIRCTIAGPIAASGSLVIGNIPGKITAASPSSVTGTASVSLQSGAPPLTPQDPDNTNNTSVATITVTSGSDVRATIARSVAGPYFVGDAFNFVVTAAYDGDVPFTLSIKDTIPANYTIGSVAASQNGWSCGVVGQIVT